MAQQVGIILLNTHTNIPQLISVCTGKPTNQDVAEWLEPRLRNQRSIISPSHIGFRMTRSYLNVRDAPTKYGDGERS